MVSRAMLPGLLCARCHMQFVRVTLTELLLLLLLLLQCR
jgi:hypothetical protein